MGYSSYDDMVAKAKAGQTIIDGGYLRTSLIEVEKLLAQSITMKSGGSLQSANYRAGKAGWKIASDGNVEFSKGTFRGDLIGGKVYFSGLGIYGLQEGDEESGVEYKASKSSSSDLGGLVGGIGSKFAKKARFTFDCFYSGIKIRLHASATSSASNGDNSIKFYAKQNGSVSESNYDLYDAAFWDKGVQGYTQGWLFNIMEPGEYIEVLIVINSNSSSFSSASVNASIRLNKKNKYLPLCVDVTEL